MSDNCSATDVRPRRRFPQRKVSDDEIRLCHQERLTSAQAAERFGVNYATINHRATLIGIALRKTKRRVWSEHDDTIVRDVGAGRITLRAGCKLIGIGSTALRDRAKALGAYIKTEKPRCGTLVSGGAIHHEQSDHDLTVGECDRLLERLRDIHGRARDEIYPGSDGPVRRFKSPCI